MTFGFIKKGLKIARIFFSGNPIWIKAAFLGVAAGTEHKYVLPNLDNLMTVVDIGANRGQFSLAARRWAPKARVFAFEPLSAPAQKFSKVFKGDLEVTLQQEAIGQDKGETIIHVSAADDSSSLLPISRSQLQLFPGTGEVRTETIHMGRLADFLSAKDIVIQALLKLDVQGFELEALQGCEDLIQRFTYVYVECSFMELYTGQPFAHEIIQWLYDRGFNLIGIYNMKYELDGKAVQGDFLFSKPGFEIS